MASYAKVPKKKVAKKKAPKKKVPEQEPLGPGVLGKGLASKAGSAIIKNRKRMCSLDGGKWKGGKCVY